MEREFDPPWKETLDHFLAAFLAYFAPKLFAIIDWSVPPVNLETELQQILRDAELGRTVADRLYRVRRKDAPEEMYLLIHAEVQSQYDPDLARRMFIYHYRIADHYGQHPVGIALLGDTSPNWRPDRYEWSEDETRLIYQFRCVKLWDWRDRLEELETTNNVIGLAVLAHLQSHLTVDDEIRRFEWKLRLLRLLYDKGYEAEEIRQLYAIIDWFLNLPSEFEQRLLTEIAEWEQEKLMPRMTSFERIGLENGLIKGRQEGLQEGLQEGRQEGMYLLLKRMITSRFKDSGEQFVQNELLNASLEELTRISQFLLEVKSIDELKAKLSE